MYRILNLCQLWSPSAWVFHSIVIQVAQAQTPSTLFPFFLFKEIREKREKHTAADP
jgi:hypothetical protein